MRAPASADTIAANTLRHARRRARLSQRDLAARAGVPHSTVARIEAGDRQPSVATWAKLLRAAGADVTVNDQTPPGAARAPRTAKWSRPVEVPTDLTELKAPISGTISLPGSVYSSGAGPNHVFNLDDEQERVRLYEIVLTDGTADDIRRYLNLNELIRLWPKLWLAPHVQAAWANAIPFPSGENA